MNPIKRVKTIRIAPPAGAGRRLVAAVSGGADSMTLLHLLDELARERGMELVVAHFNHRLRGRAGDADEALVRRAARRLGWPCVTGAADTRAAAARRGVSLEMAARDLRHAFLARVARRHRAPVIALAHHADDQVELFFLRLLRGAGGGGLGGMTPLSPSPADARARLFRPLLGFTKARLLALARERGIEFREDASNRSPAHLRNRLRHELLPLLRKLQPALARTMARAMSIAGAEADLAEKLAAKWLKARRRAGFDKLPLAVRRRVVQIQLRALGVEPDFQLVETLREQPGRKVSVADGQWVERNADGAVGRTRAVKLRFAADGKVVSLERAPGRRGFARFAGGGLRWRVLRRPAGFRASGGAADGEVFDADQVGPRFTLRHWRAGDRFQPVGMAAPVKLQDWFTNRKVAAEERRRRALAATAAGEIFWVEGERIGERAKVTRKTRRLLAWRWERGQPPAPRIARSLRRD